MPDRVFSPRGLYRSRHGVLLGVCRGFASYFDISVFWVRVLAVLGVLGTGLWPGVAIYLVAALLMKPEPVLDAHSEGEREFYHSYAASRKLGLSRLKAQFDRLERRIRRMEDVVTSRDFSWRRRFEQDRSLRPQNTLVFCKEKMCLPGAVEEPRIVLVRERAAGAVRAWS
jgi:phage shock protein C